MEKSNVRPSTASLVDLTQQKKKSLKSSKMKQKSKNKAKRKTK